jgi:hypothetical protein
VPEQREREKGKIPASQERLIYAMSPILLESPSDQIQGRTLLARRALATVDTVLNRVRRIIHEFVAPGVGRTHYTHSCQQTQEAV